MDTLLHDLRYAIRSLRKSPGFTLVAIITLALGIGANTAIFSTINRLVLHRLPFANADRLVDIDRIDRQGGIIMEPRAVVVDAWRERAHSLEALEPYRTDEVLFGGNGEPAMIRAEWVSPTFLPFLGLSPSVGRTFTQDEATRGGPNVAMLGYAFWQRRFGGDPHALSQVIHLDGKPYTIVGVMPHALQLSQLGGLVDVWLPLHPAASVTDLVSVIGRLRPGVAAEQAQRELDAIQAQVPASTVETRQWASYVSHAGGFGHSSDTLVLLAAAVAIVLVIACANVAQLFLARGAARQQEMVLRASLGAGRARLVRQLLTEGFVVAGAGGVIGVLLAWWSAGLLGSVQSSRRVLVEPIGLDAHVLLFALGVSIVTAVAFALVPALRVTKLDLGVALKSGTNGSGGPRERGRSRNVLIGIEVALSVVLLAAAGLLVRQMIQLQRIDVGFDPGGLVAARITVPAALYPTVASQTALVEQFRTRAAHLAGTAGAVVTETVPSQYDVMLGQLEIQGGTAPPELTHALIEGAFVPSGYFHVFGIPLIEGRGFTDAELRAHAHVMVIGQALARALAPAGSAVGMRVRLYAKDEWSTVIGVARDVAAGSIGSIDTWQAYLPFPSKNPTPWIWVVARARPGAPPLGPELRRLVHAVDPQLPVRTVATMESVMRADLATFRFQMWLLTLFAGMALLLAIVGLFGVLSYAVARRTRELGVRMALGARASSVRALVVRQGMIPAVIGLCAGLAASFASSRILATVFRGIHPNDPLTLGVVAAVVIASTLLASYLPARRATAVDPVTALRSE